jgi:hypothetical protein
VASPNCQGTAGFGEFDNQRLELHASKGHVLAVQ